MPVPRPSACSLPMIGYAPMGLSRWKVTSSPLFFVRLSARTIGMEVFDWLPLVAAMAASILGMEPVRWRIWVLRWVQVWKTPTACWIIAPGAPAGVLVLVFT